MYASHTECVFLSLYKIQNIRGKFSKNTFYKEIQDK